MMSTAPTFTVLFDSTGDLFDNEFIDVEGRVIYKLTTLQTQPRVTQLERTNERLALHPTEPWRATMHFGSGGELGHLQLGERSVAPMVGYLRKKNGPPGRFRSFVAVDGNEYQWRPGSRRLECYDKNDRLIALYEWLLDGPSHARLEIKIGGWHILSELIATLLLNRYAIRYEV
ncbi:unnamed protein product [Rhizoctonia solani]|uniref:DUF6593 domain-containing protein n=1 Tax=Rhizoctonia solani TaxID=456999 RepID=A0A8H3CUY6_9AGAM|nr:unnamed protein product [Rhizoctonia solani]CAE6497162.1 unnamed protein product [Rhizoctonia solani]